MHVCFMFITQLTFINIVDCSIVVFTLCSCAGTLVCHSLVTVNTCMQTNSCKLAVWDNFRVSCNIVSYKAGEFV